MALNNLFDELAKHPNGFNYTAQVRQTFVTFINGLGKSIRQAQYKEKFELIDYVDLYEGHQNAGDPDIFKTKLKTYLVNNLTTEEKKRLSVSMEPVKKAKANANMHGAETLHMKITMTLHRTPIAYGIDSKVFNEL